jgi:hypothetical protein
MHRLIRGVCVGEQVALGSFICAVMVCVSVALRPYIDEAHNNLSLLCLVHLTVTLYVGLLLKVNTLGPGPLLTVLISFIILICVCIVAGALTLTLTLTLTLKHNPQTS